MKRTVTLMCLAAFVVGISHPSQAQDRKFYQSVYLNGNIPTGTFGKSIAASETIGQDATVPLGYEAIGKDASIGFGLGYRASYHFDVGLGEVAPYANIDILWNTISSKWRDKYSTAYLTTPTYFNIPFQAGVTYIYDELPWPDIRAYGEFGIGTDFLWITSEGNGKGIPKFSYKPNFAFAWSLGAGAYFGRYFSAGLYYYGMGKHNVDYTDGTLKDNTMAAEQKAHETSRPQVSVGSVMLRLGFHF